jgi:hypothetical protein
MRRKMLRCFLILWMCAVLGSPPVMADTCSTPSRACALGRALTIYGQTSRLSMEDEVLLDVAAAQLDAGRTDIALVLGDILINCWTACSRTSRAIETLVSAGLFDAALSFATNHENEVRRASVLMSVAHAATAAGEEELAQEAMARALATANEVEDLKVRGLVFAAMASALGRDSADMAEDAIDRALSMVQSNSSLAADAYVLTEIAEAQAATGSPVAARTTASRIADSNLRSQAMLRIALRSATTGDFAAARDAIEAADALAQLVTENAATNEPDLHNPWCFTKAGTRDSILRSIVSAWVQIGDIESSLASAARIENMNARLEALADAVKLHATRVSREQLFVLLTSARKLAGEIEAASCRDTTFSALAGAEAAAGAVEAALATAERIEDSNFRASVLLEIAKTDISSGHVDIVEKIGIPAIRAAAWAEIAMARIEVGNRTGAQDAANLAWQIIVANPPPRRPPTGLVDELLRLFPLFEVDKVLIRLGDVEGVRRAMEFREETIPIDDRLAEIAKAQAYAGNAAAAMATVDAIGRSRRRVDALLEIAKALPR